MGMKYISAIGELTVLYLDQPAFDLFLREWLLKIKETQVWRSIHLIEMIPC